MEPLPEPSRTGTVVLDIGGDVGAAIVHTPASLAGAEIEIRVAGAPWDGRHVAVRARQLADGEVFTAVFDALQAGRYEVRLRRPDPDTPQLALEVKGGRVTELYLPA